MGRYALVYRGGGGIPETPEEGQAAMAEWGAWMGGLGAALVDGGAPFAGRTVIGAASPLDLSGYTLIEAESLDRATEMARGCPVLAHGGSVDVLECIDMGM